eukprot:m.18293 g.18293  ORF g.18293 m.18293 type:complete len:211 (+) comp7777_c0_seq2:278-910(+)
MELAYNRAVRLKYTVEQRMGELIQTQQKDLEVETGQLLNECQDAFETYEVYVRKRPVSERDKLKQELDQMRADIQDTENKYKAYVAQQEAMRSQAEDDKRRRDQLLTRRGDDTEIYISSHDVAYSEGLTQANSGIENLLRTGAGILDDLSHQRDVMKRVQRRIRDVTSKLGLSNTVMRLIDQRTTQDKLFLLAGIIITSLLMYLVYHFFG